METLIRIARSLDRAVSAAEQSGGPPRLAAAMRHAVFPGGARIRPRLCLAVAAACGEDDPALSEAAAAALELLHCASLVHDDLPCFDDAALRRGLPTVHRSYGERLAVLAGDALIVAAFQLLAEVPARVPQRVTGLVALVARGVGAPDGIAAGQAWECESKVDLHQYQQAKTGALFAAATAAGALSAGGDAQAWRTFGERLGHAYQVADDIQDAAGDALLMGKPAGRDAALGRPSAAHAYGLQGATEFFGTLVRAAIEAIPPSPGASRLRDLVAHEAQRLVPVSLRRDLAVAA